MTKQNNARGILLMLWASLAFAVMAAATKWLGGGLPASEVVFVRSVLSSILLFAILAIRKNKDGIGKKPLILASRGVIGFVALTLYFWCIPRIHLGTAVMLNYTAPIFAVAASRLFFKEKNSLPDLLLIGGAFMGVYLLASPQLREAPDALMAGLASGFLAGMVHLLIRRSHDERESPLLIILYFTIACTAGSALMRGLGPWPMPDAGQWTALLVITASSLLGQLGLTYSLRSARISVASPFGYITPVIGLVIGFIFWKEDPGLPGILGSAVIILCGSVLYRRQV